MHSRRVGMFDNPDFQIWEKLMSSPEKFPSFGNYVSNAIDQQDERKSSFRDKAITYLV